MTPAVELRALTKSFANVRAVDGLDLTITPGEIVAVLGPRGFGTRRTQASEVSDRADQEREPRQPGARIGLTAEVLAQPDRCRIPSPPTRPDS